LAAFLTDPGDPALVCEDQRPFFASREFFSPYDNKLDGVAGPLSLARVWVREDSVKQLSAGALYVSPLSQLNRDARRLSEGVPQSPEESVSPQPPQDSMHFCSLTLGWRTGPMTTSFLQQPVRKLDRHEAVYFSDGSFLEGATPF